MGCIGFVARRRCSSLSIKDYFPRRVVLEPDNALALGGVVVCRLPAVASGLGVRAALKVDPATALGG